MKRTFILVALILPLVLPLGVTDSNQAKISPRQDYAEIAAVLKPFIEKEIADKQLPALSVAIVDDQQVVWAEGFGYADPATKTPATAESIYRICSVSKLFTDIGIMRLVERGEINLDAPITKYLPDFHPKNRFKKPITLRQLMCHRSGLLREPPVGNYFDPAEPTLAQTVDSLNETELVYAPETHLKYSNAAIAVVGTTIRYLFLKRTIASPC